jgi:hypothetical protein
MSFTFLDTFTGGAVGSNALAGHTPDTTSNTFKLVNLDGSLADALSGSGILYAPTSGGAFVQARVDATGLSYPYTFGVTALQGWDTGGSAAYPAQATQANYFNVATFGNLGASIAARIYNISAGFNAVSGLNGSLGNVAYAAGLYAVLDIVSSTGNTYFLPVPIGAGPWDVSISADALYTELVVNGSVVASTTLAVGSLAGVFDIQLRVGMGISSAFLAPPVAGFWTGFIETSETP